MAAQLGLALDNVEAVLRAAGMTLANITRLNYYTTADVDSFMASYEVITERLSAAGVRPPGNPSGSRPTGVPGADDRVGGDRRRLARRTAGSSTHDPRSRTRAGTIVRRLPRGRL